MAYFDLKYGKGFEKRATHPLIFVGSTPYGARS